MQIARVVMGIAAACIAGLVGVSLHRTADQGQEDLLMQRLDADLGLKDEDYAALRRRGRFAEALDIKLQQHATSNYGNPDRIEGFLEFLSANQVVMPDGQLATVAYHDAMKIFFPGDVAVFSGFYERWQNAYPQSPLPIIVKASNTLAVEAEYLRAALMYPGHLVEQSNADPKKLKQVQDDLVSNKAIGSRDPYWYHLMVEVSIFLGASQDEIKALVAEGLEKYPSNIQLPILGSNRFASKWGGEANDIFHYAK